METIYKTSVWHQFGAAIDTLDNALRACPDELWRVRLWDHPAEQPGYAEFWYIAYHTLFWLDLYLSGSVEGFAPPAPFTLSELDPTGFPERPYTRAELQHYLDYGRQKCQATIAALRDESAQQPCKFPWGEMSFAELLLYNMRHVQEHGAQLSLILGQRRNLAAGWVAQAKYNGTATRKNITISKAMFLFTGLSNWYKSRTTPISTSWTSSALTMLRRNSDSAAMILLAVAGASPGTRRKEHR